MPVLSIIPNLDANPDKELDEFIHNEGQFSEIVQFARVPNATDSGDAAIIIKMRLPNGALAFGRITQKLYMGAGHAFNGAKEREDHIAKHGEPPPVDNKCNMIRSLLGLPYPRTCELCKLGPCHNVKS